MGQLAHAARRRPGHRDDDGEDAGRVGSGASTSPTRGVRLTPAGEKLAALVLRRHRLIELFLVKVMGMSWTEVHEEAEHLEHAVSERLIDRIDEMLGRPAVDPHGDPIPDPDGVRRARPLDTLLTCPLHAPVTVQRVSRSGREFLRFVERHDLKPGSVVEVEERDDAADSVRLRGRDEREITIGARAASKVLVQAATALVGAVCCAGAGARPGAAPRPRRRRPARKDEPFQITDNSFLVEEAFNQEPDDLPEHLRRSREERRLAGDLHAGVAGAGMRHQLSYTLVGRRRSDRASASATSLNYRYQALEEGPGRPAFSPRLSAIVPIGRSASIGDAITTACR